MIDLKPLFRPAKVTNIQFNPPYGPLPRKGNPKRKLITIATSAGPREYHVTKGWRS